MQRVIVILVVAALMGACNLSNQDRGKDSSPAETEKIVSATIEELLSKPTDYQGKEVAVPGMVTHVCKHGGQKCFILAGDGETQLRIVTGGEIDEFETSLEGSTVAFRGVFRIESTEENGEQEARKHHTEEMPHYQAEQAGYFIEAVDYKEITP